VLSCFQEKSKYIKISFIKLISSITFSEFLCQIEQENMEHFLLRCPALNEKRKITLSKLKQTLIQSTGQDKWTETIVGNKTLLLQTIIDVFNLA
jgi:hypothetical protein